MKDLTKKNQWFFEFLKFILKPHLYTKISYPAKFENQQIIVYMHTQVLITKPFQNFINKEKKTILIRRRKLI
jgi:hypothetical protein